MHKLNYLMHVIMYYSNFKYEEYQIYIHCTCSTLSLINFLCFTTLKSVLTANGMVPLSESVVN